MKNCFFIFIILWGCVSLLKIKLDLKKSASSASSTSGKENPFADMSNADLDKMMKQYGLDNKDFGILSSEAKNDKKTEKSNSKKNSKDLLMDLNLDDDPLKSLLDGDKKNKNIPIKPIIEIYHKNREILKNFEITQRDAFNLIYFMSKFQMYSKLPITAMNIITDVQKKPSYQHILNLHKNKTEEMEYIISNTLNSQTFIDQENKVGRKGLLTMIDKDTADIKLVWAVLNSKVFTFYKSSNYLNIINIFRVSMIVYKNFAFSPCFFIYYDNNEYGNFKNSQVLICTLNYREKDYWIRTLEHHQQQYQDFINEYKNKK